MPKMTDLNNVRIFEDKDGNLFLTSTDERLGGEQFKMRLSEGSSTYEQARKIIGSDHNRGFPFTPGKFNKRFYNDALRFSLGIDESGQNVDWNVQEMFSYNYPPSLLITYPGGREDPKNGSFAPYRLITQLVDQSLAKGMQVSMIGSGRKGKPGEDINHVSGDNYNDVHYLVKSLVSSYMPGAPQKIVFIFGTKISSDAEKEILLLLRQSRALGIIIVWISKTDAALQLQYQDIFFDRIAFGRNSLSDALKLEFKTGFDMPFMHAKYHNSVKNTTQDFVIDYF